MSARLATWLCVASIWATFCLLTSHYILGSLLIAWVVATCGLALWKEMETGEGE